MFLTKLTNLEEGLSKRFLRLAFSFLLAALLFSCSDQGCIEADDFGEYDTQTLEILSNSSQDNCVYDVTKPLTDASQGVGLKSCFTSGSVTIIDETGVAVAAVGGGCSNIVFNAKYRKLCADQCVSNCMTNLGTGPSDTPEPGWVPTDEKNGTRNGGVVVRPASQISVRVIGNVKLGDQIAYPDFFVAVDDPAPQSRKSDWTSQNLYVKSGKVLNLAFSGKFVDGSPANGLGTSAVGAVGSTIATTNTIDSKNYNAGRRLAIYIQQSPPGTYIDDSQTNEKVSFVGAPPLPDVSLWQCAYSGPDLQQSVCNNKSYGDAGYANADQNLINNIFPLTSDRQSVSLGRYGGMIRWYGDGIQSNTYDPFVVVNCNDSACAGAGDVDQSAGSVLGDLSASLVVTVPVSSKVSFKELLSGEANGCNNLSLQVKVVDANNQAIYTYDGISNPTVALSRASWSTQNISAEAGQKLVISAVPDSYIFDKVSYNCGQAIAVKFAAYQDIAIEKSGFVNFATLNTSNNTPCTINARIINPSGRKTSYANGLAADFYEYSDFNSNVDPLSNLLVPSLVNGVTWQTGATENGSSKVFVRKGQVIRFSPESWDGTLSTAAGPRQCGIGMAMRIDPRPALLCRGYASDQVSNPQCVPETSSSGVLIGCKEASQECMNSGNAASYCPLASCWQTLASCGEGVAPNYQRHCTIANPDVLPGGCDLPDPRADGGATYTAANCKSCSSLRLANANRSPYISQTNMAQCYDLENYAGKVSNIPLTGFAADDFADATKAKTRGATRLGGFNGEYGDLEKFSVPSNVDSTYLNNQIFKVAQPINITQGGRLKFMLLEGNDFLPSTMNNYYSDNGGRGDNYNGANGFRINITSFLEFFNGEWLEAKLCKELLTNIYSCKGLQLADGAVDITQPDIVSLQDHAAGSSSYTGQSKSSFYFDQYGTLTRSKATPAGDPGECINGYAGDNYYCHTNALYPASKLRITFKIKDPEQANCATDSVLAPNILNGIKITNNYFQISDCATNPAAPTIINGISQQNGSCSPNAEAGQICTAADYANGATCKKEFRCASKYANNSGKYYATVRVKTPGSNISRIVNDVVSPVIEAMDGKKDGSTIGQAERIYNLIINDSRYKAILSISLVLMFSFYGFGYLIGVTESGIGDLIQKMIKIGLIYLFVGPEGWTWFNELFVKFFKNGTDYISFLMASSFDTSPELTYALEHHDFYDKSILFSSVDKVFGIFFSSTVQKKISALLFASIFGWLYMIIIYYGMLLYIYAVANSVLLYLTSQVFISILFVLGPLFFLFTLFSQTKEMFDKWLSQLISFSLQQIFLLTTLAFFNMMMYEVIKMVLGYKVCWDEVWVIHIITRISLMSFWTIAALPPSTNPQTDPGNIGGGDGIPSFFTILFIWVIADLMLKFVTFMTDMAASISGGIKASTLGSGIKAAVQSAKGFAGARAKEVWGKTGGQAVKRLDKALFNSGELADQERAKKKEENAVNSAHKKAFASAGAKGISEFKKANGEKLATLPKADQEKLLRAAKNDAIAKEGKKRGLNEEQIDKLKKDKGLKYEGDNVFGAVLQAGKQSVLAGGALRKSSNDKVVSTKFSDKEAKEALKATDEDGRKTIIEGVKKGNVEVKKAGWEGFKQNVKKVAKGTAVVTASVATGGVLPAVLGAKAAVKNEKARDEAIGQLVARGEISKMTAGFGRLRPPEEDKKIRDQMKKNKAEQDGKGNKMSSANTVAKLKIEAKTLDEVQSGKGGDHARADGIGKALLGERKTAKNFFSKFGERSKLEDQNKAERVNIVKDNIKGKMDSAKNGQESAKAEVAGHRAEIARIKAETPNLETRAAKADATPEEKLKVREEAKENSAKLKLAEAGIHEASAREKNYGEAFAKANKSFESIKSAEEVVAAGNNGVKLEGIYDTKGLEVAAKKGETKEDREKASASLDVLNKAQKVIKENS